MPPNTTRRVPKLRSFGSDCSLPKAMIITRQRDFEQIRQNGRYYRGRLMVLGILQTEELPAGVAFIAGKKVHRRAVKRNRAKRLLREAFRLTRSRIAPTTQIVCIAKSTILDASAAAVQDEMIYFLKKAGIWQSN